TRPRPFRVGRDGLALGEGAAVIALGSADLAKAHRVQSFGYVAGFGASTDAVHLTAPDPTGRGLARAAKAALNDANVARVGLISAHATATPFNDPAEAKAIAAALGGAPPEGVHPFKAQIGHTLGAAGALEALAALDAVQRGVKPAAAGDGNIDPDCAVPLFASNERLVDATALKLSSAFGGTNAALVLRSAPPEAREPSRRGRARAVFLRGFAAIPGALESADFTAWLARQHPHAHRLDRMARLALSAARALSGSTEAPSTALFPRGTGILLGHALATLEQNELFDSRLRERGPRAVEPRRFPATSPNAAAGECAIAFGLEGPSFAVGASLHGAMEALAVARDLVAVGDAPAMLVIAADLQGTTSSALLSAAEAPPICPGACAALLTAEPAAGAVPLEGAIPETLAGGRDWAWAGPFGHDELRAYLAGL
ncbi:MAG TPA: beta-ketoacyl synthase N-terminal-like domain-containing protein, partial [Polyangiaceae bacterium]